MNKLSLTVLLALGFSPLGTHATPLYFLMEGTVTSSDAGGYLPAPIGSAFKYEAVWDDQHMFGADTDPSGQKALFGNVGFTGYTVKETPTEWGYTTEYNGGNHYTTKAGQYYFEGTSSGIGPSDFTELYQHSADWSFQLTTEKSLSGDKIIFSYNKGWGDGYGHDGTSYQFEFSDLSGAALKSNLLEFNWNAATAGAGSGTATIASGGGHGPAIYWDNRTGQLTRLVLSYNPADVAAIPVPAAIWFMGSALLGLFGVSRRKV
jgi:hypothetical protein